MWTLLWKQIKTVILRVIKLNTYAGCLKWRRKFLFKRAEILAHSLNANFVYVFGMLSTWTWLVPHKERNSDFFLMYFIPTTHSPDFCPSTNTCLELFNSSSAFVLSEPNASCLYNFKMTSSSRSLLCVFIRTCGWSSSKSLPLQSSPTFDVRK